MVDRFGGGNARQALIQYLGTDADQLLRSRYNRGRRWRVVFRGGRGDAAGGVDELRQRPAQRAGAAVFHPGAGPGASRRRPAARGEHPGRDEPSGHLHRPVRRGREPGRAARTGTAGIATATLTAHFPHHGGARALGPVG